jgi:hypothetical protein
VPGKPVLLPARAAGTLPARAFSEGRLFELHHSDSLFSQNLPQLLFV